MQQLLEQGEALYNDGRIEQAEACFRSVLEQAPENKDAYNNLAVIAFGMKEFCKALDYVIQSLRIDPLCKDTLMNLCDILREIDELGGSLPFLEKFLDKFPEDKDIRQILEEAKQDIHEINDQGLRHSREGNLAEAKDCFVRSLAIDDNQPEIRARLIETLDRIRKQNIALTQERIKDIPPTFFDKRVESNTQRDGFLKYVPEAVVPEKTGLNILFISDCEVAGNQIRLTKLINHRTTHKARNIVLKRDYLNYGNDLIADTEARFAEARELIHQADFFHFTRFIPMLPGIDWDGLLTPNNCLIDYMGSILRNNKKQIAQFHNEKKIFGLNKYDYSMYKDIEFLMYHFPLMFDAEPHATERFDWNWRQKEEIVISHSPTNPESKHTHYILPILERVKQKSKQKIRINLIMGKPHTEVLKEKAGCDIFIDQIRPMDFDGPGCPGQNSYEAVALNKVTITSLDNFFLSFHADAPIFSATLENLEEVVITILKNPHLAEKKMQNSRDWLKAHLSPVLIMNRYLQLYSLIINNNHYVNSFDRFFINLDKGL